MRRIYARRQAREERGRLLSAACGAEVGEQERHNHSINYAACLVCSVFSAACTIISHERQHVVCWWFEAGPEVQDGVGGSK